MTLAVLVVVLTATSVLAVAVMQVQVKTTVPAGAGPPGSVTVAVNVTAPPTADGFTDEDKVMTGTAAALKVSRRTAASVGSYSISGVSSTLIYSGNAAVWTQQGDASTIWTAQSNASTNWTIQ